MAALLEQAEEAELTLVVADKDVRVQYLWMSAVLCANLAIRFNEPSNTEHSNGCSQEVQ